MSLRGVLACLLICWCLAFIGRARAQDPGSVCAAAETLERLTPDDREFLRHLCGLSEAEAELWQGRVSIENDRLMDIVRRVVPRGQWEAATLALLLPEGLLELGAFRADCRREGDQQKLIAAIQESISKTRAAVDTLGAAYVHSLVSPCRWRAAESLATLGPGGWSAGAGTPEEMGRTVPIQVLAPLGSVVRLFSAGPSPTLQLLKAVTWEGNPAQEVNHEGDYRLFRGLLPLNAAYVLTIGQPVIPGQESREFPRVFSGVAGGLVTHVSDAVDYVTFDVQIASDEALEIYLDGVPLDAAHREGTYSGVWLLPVGPSKVSHKLAAVAPAVDGARVTRLSRTYELEPLARVEAYFDLTNRGATDTVGLISVKADGCVEAGIDSTKLRAYSMRYVQAAGLEVSDVRSLSDVTRFFSQLKETVQSLGGEAVGADRGRLDSSRNLSTGAAELLRQGFADLLALEMKCSRRGAGGWDYSLSADRMDLQKLGESPRNHLTGSNLEDVLQQEIELVPDQAELAPKLESVLARALGLPYVELHVIGTQMPFHEPVVAQVESYLPSRHEPYSVRLALGYLTSSSASQVCGSLADIRRLRARRDYEFLQGLAWQVGDRARLAADGKLARTLASIEPSEASLAVLRVELLGGPDDATLAEAYECLDLSKSDVGVQVELGMLFAGGTDYRSAEEASGYFVSGTVHWTSPFWFLRIGTGIAVTRLVRRGETPPTWNDVSNITRAGLNGSTPYEIDEMGVYVAFPNAEATASACELLFKLLCTQLTRRMVFLARATPLVGLHFVDKGGIQQADDFRGSGKTEHPVSLGALGQLGARLQVNDDYAFDVRATLAVPRWLDYTRQPDDANVLRRHFWGASFGVAWGQ